MAASNYERVRSISRIAGADFSAAQGIYRFCKVNPNPAVVGGVNIDAGAVILAGNGERAIGVLCGKQIAGHAIEVALEGRVLVVAGAAIAVGAVVQSDGNGAAITQASTGCVMGEALEAAGGAGTVISINLAPQGAP